MWCNLPWGPAESVSLRWFMPQVCVLQKWDCRWLFWVSRFTGQVLFPSSCFPFVKLPCTMWTLINTYPGFTSACHEPTHREAVSRCEELFPRYHHIPDNLRVGFKSDFYFYFLFFTYIYILSFPYCNLCKTYYIWQFMWYISR